MLEETVLIYTNIADLTRIVRHKPRGLIYSLALLDLTLALFK